MFLKSLIFLVLVFFISSVSAQYGGQACTTPNGESAQCTPIYSCPILLDALRTRNRNSIEFIKASVCKNYIRGEYVCCGNYSKYITEDDDEGDDDVDDFRSPNTYTGSYGNRPQNQNQRYRGKPQTFSRPSLLPDRDVCGKSEENRILNGDDTELQEFPSMALLEYKTRNGRSAHSCGGILISNRYVLTAAHCVVGEIERKVGKLFRVRLGEWDKETDPDCDKGICAPPHKDIMVEEAFPHPEYTERDKSRRNDIALVRLTVPVSFDTDSIQPICLPQRGDQLPDRFWIAGWGQTETGRSSNKKLKLLVPYYPQNRCQNVFQRYSVNLDKTQLCAGGEEMKDSCRGDSGGPLMYQNEDGKWIAAGVVSFGVKCGTKDVPGVYTRISEYMDWIIQNIRP